MPHECTSCGRTFPDGSKEMLSGCPDCGGNKFQFAPAGRATSGAAEPAGGSADSSGTTGDTAGDATETLGSTGTVERAAETVREWVSSDDDRSGDPAADASRRDGSSGVADPGRRDGSTGAERSAGTDRSWPSSDDPADAESSEPGEFGEWPETARRPEDRSPAPDDESGGSPDRQAASGSASPSADEPVADRPTSEPTRASIAESENSAQADARSEVVPTDDLPAGSDADESSRDAASGRADRTVDSADGDAGDRPPEHGRVVSEPSGDSPSIEELREELNEQFESIKIVSPGQYELNLMELYNREEYIISLQEDGRYVIEVPDSWRSEDD